MLRGTSLRSGLRSRFSGWFAKWGGLLPLLVAEFIAWVGFGALLPVMPLYFRQHGVDLAMLGVVIAAWPAARLVGEPIFGYVADRTARVPVMVVGLVVTGIATAMPLVFIGPLPFLVFRAISGFATAAYDPAARGYITDAAPAGRRGEAFGLYGAAQMGGLLLGPAIGGFGAAVFGGFEFVFAFGAVGTLLAAVAIALRVPEVPASGRHHTPAHHDLAEFRGESPVVHERAAQDLEADERAAAEAGAARADGHTPPRSLRNRLLLAALALTFGGYFASGTYEVVWSLFLEARGAGLDLIGLTFAMFGLPVLLLSPIAGRLVDRRGVYPFVVVGSIVAALTSVSYTIMAEVILAVPLVMIEATGFALLNPALYAIVAAGSPRGRSSTAQGIYGAFGTIGTIVASVLAGYLATLDLRMPFWLCAGVVAVGLVIGLLIGGRPLRELGRQRRVEAAPQGAV